MKASTTEIWYSLILKQDKTTWGNGIWYKSDFCLFSVPAQIRKSSTPTVWEIQEKVEEYSKGRDQCRKYETDGGGMCLRGELFGDLGQNWEACVSETFFCSNRWEVVLCSATTEMMKPTERTRTTKGSTLRPGDSSV
jgi:hypothetical protein